MGQGDDRRFEHSDLHYIGLRLGTARTYVWGISCWSRSLERIARGERTHVRITDVPHLARGARRVAALLHLPSGQERTIELRWGEPIAETHGVMVADSPALPTAGTARGARGRGLDGRLWPRPQRRPHASPAKRSASCCGHRFWPGEMTLMTAVCEPNQARHRKSIRPFP